MPVIEKAKKLSTLQYPRSISVTSTILKFIRVQPPLSGRKVDGPHDQSLSLSLSAAKLVDLNVLQLMSDNAAGMRV